MLLSPMGPLLTRPLRGLVSYAFRASSAQLRPSPHYWRRGKLDNELQTKTTCGPMDPQTLIKDLRGPTETGRDLHGVPAESDFPLSAFEASSLRASANPSVTASA